MRAGPSGNYHSFAYAPQTPVGVSRSSQTPLRAFACQNGGPLIFCHPVIVPESLGKNSRTTGMSIANRYLHNGATMKPPCSGERARRLILRKLER